MVKRRKPPAIVCVIGKSGSGKTTTIEYLTRHLTKLGFRVGVGKHIHKEGFTFDTKGKDTWRHARAGAKTVIGISPNEIAVFKKENSKTSFQQMMRLFREEGVDIVLLEGFSSICSKEALPKILAVGKKTDLEHALAKSSPPVLAITGPISPLRKTPSIVPIINPKRNGAILLSIMRQFISTSL